MSHDETRTTDADVLKALENANIALLCAAEILARRYGRGTEKAKQLCGAALLISEDWIPAICAEAGEPANV